MREYDVELGGSEFVPFSHAPETFKSFIDYYFELVTKTLEKSMGTNGIGSIDGRQEE